MANLKDLIVNGASRFIGNLFANKAQLTTLEVPTSAGGTTYGPGTDGQVLKSNGTSSYWGNSIDDSVIAPVEPTSTASEYHNAGEVFMLNGNLYWATDNIGVGETIVPGTNVQLMTVAQYTNYIAEMLWEDVGWSYVPNTCTVNGHALSSDVTVTASDVGLGNVANVLQYSASNKPPASNVTYDNTETGFGATNVQEAIDELNILKSTKEPDYHFHSTVTGWYKFLEFDPLGISTYRNITLLISEGAATMNTMLVTLRFRYTTSFEVEATILSAFHYSRTDFAYSTDSDTVKFYIKKQNGSSSLNSGIAFRVLNSTNYTGIYAKLDDNWTSTKVNSLPADVKFAAFAPRVPDYTISTAATGWFKFLEFDVPNGTTPNIMLLIKETYGATSAVGVWSLVASAASNVVTGYIKQLSSITYTNQSIGWTASGNTISFYFYKRAANSYDRLCFYILTSINRNGTFFDISSYWTDTQISGTPSGIEYSTGQEDGTGNVISNTYATKTEMAALNQSSSITLQASWTDNQDGTFTQTGLSITGATINSSVTLKPTVAQMKQLITDGTTAIIITNNQNDPLTFTATAFGDAPTILMTIACILTEES